MAQSINGVIALVVLVGFFVFLIRLGRLAYHYKTRGRIQRVTDDGRRHIDGDRVYRDDRLNELLYARDPDEDRKADPLEFVLLTEPTVTCPECNTRNRAEFRFCRECAAELPE